MVISACNLKYLCSLAACGLQQVVLKSSYPPFEKNNKLYFRSKASVFFKVDVLLTSEVHPRETRLKISGSQVDNYFLNFLLSPTSPIKPEPSSQTAAGMWTGLPPRMVSSS